ncbi:hypothetical protein HK101_000473 [Irineochytrium annulatum]|nr:hypothetical protein HK101_000473 [Irineochytrium annulatum]
MTAPRTKAARKASPTQVKAEVVSPVNHSLHHTDFGLPNPTQPMMDSDPLFGSFVDLDGKGDMAAGGLSDDFLFSFPLPSGGNVGSLAPVPGDHPLLTSEDMAMILDHPLFDLPVEDPASLAVHQQLLNLPSPPHTSSSPSASPNTKHTNASPAAAAAFDPLFTAPFFPLSPAEPSFMELNSLMMPTPTPAAPTLLPTPSAVIAPPPKELVTLLRSDTANACQQLLNEPVKRKPGRKKKQPGDPTPPPVKAEEGNSEGGEGQGMTKLQARMAKNREAADQSRKRKRDHLVSLESHAQALITENDELRARILQLEQLNWNLGEENKVLRARVPLGLPGVETTKQTIQNPVNTRSAGAVFMVFMFSFFMFLFPGSKQNPGLITSHPEFDRYRQKVIDAPDFPRLEARPHHLLSSGAMDASSLVPSGPSIASSSNPYPYQPLLSTAHPPTTLLVSTSIDESLVAPSATSFAVPLANLTDLMAALAADRPSALSEEARERLAWLANLIEEARARAPPPTPASHEGPRRRVGGGSRRRRIVPLEELANPPPVIFGEPSADGGDKALSRIGGSRAGAGYAVVEEEGSSEGGAFCGRGPMLSLVANLPWGTGEEEVTIIGAMGTTEGGEHAGRGGSFLQLDVEVVGARLVNWNDTAGVEALAMVAAASSESAALGSWAPAGKRDSKERSDFRNYTAGSHLPRVETFYREQRRNQTYDAVLALEARHLTFRRARMAIWPALERLNALRDDSDPDTDQLDQLQHALQSAQACRKRMPDCDWLHLVALVHDLGKLLALPAEDVTTGHALPPEPQWAVVGDTFPVGCQFDERSNILPETHAKLNSDARHPLYSTVCGVYEGNCGLEKVKMSWGHDEYLYRVLRNHPKCTLPNEGLGIIRFHSFYPLHTGGGYKHLMAPGDEETLRWVKMFNEFDLYSKDEHARCDVETLRPYYQGLIDKYIPGVLEW